MPLRRMVKFISALIVCAVISTIHFGSVAHATETINPSLFAGKDYRLIGPWRGGRALAVSGVIGDPLTYYMGAAGGGVWKTTNAGTTWFNVSDGYFNVGTIGAITVSESDPNVVYVGTGEGPIRGVTTASGDGMYKSTDAGKTWKHIGLEMAGQFLKCVFTQQTLTLPMSQPKGISGDQTKSVAYIVPKTVGKLGNIY